MGSSADRKKALLRGELVHRLLQALPDIPQEHRAEAAQRYLAREDGTFTVGERDAIAAQVGRILDDPRFRELFAPGSRAEVPIVGRLSHKGRMYAVSGQVDRLVVTDGAVMIADYKTNHPAPRQPEDAWQYVTQLALYRAVLAKLYPGRDIRAALVWTQVPDLMTLSASVLDQAMADFTPA